MTTLASDSIFQKYQMTAKICNINDLPTEILGDILNYLDNRTLKIAAKVCVQWKNVINNTTKINKKFSFNVEFGFFTEPDADDEIIYRDFFFFNPSYNESEVYEHFYVTFYERRFKDYLIKYKDQIEVLELEYATVQLLTKTIGCLTNLKSLTIGNIMKLNDNKYEPISLPNLKFLSICRGFNFIKDHQLEELYLHDEDSDSEINDFLMTCNNLKKLKLGGKIQKLNFDKFPFKLKSFEFIAKVDGSDDNIEKTKSVLVEFLKMQSESLEKLFLSDNIRRTNQGVIGKAINFAVSEMNLKELKLSKFDNEDAIGVMKPNYSIKLLKINYFKSNQREQKNFFTAFKRVEKLNLQNEDCFGSFEHISRSMISLEHLKLLIISNSFDYRDLTFENVETLEVQFDSEYSNLSKFVTLAKCFPNVKFINMSTYEPNVPMSIYGLMNHLKELKIFTIDNYSSVVKMRKKFGAFVIDAVDRKYSEF